MRLEEFLTFFFFSFFFNLSGQVSFGKVFVGLAGVAVVVILIAVPTALHLRGESAIHVTRRDRWIVRVPRCQ